MRDGNVKLRGSIVLAMLAQTGTLLKMGIASVAK
jgi:hypothetical protein